MRRTRVCLVALLAVALAACLDEPGSAVGTEASELSGGDYQGGDYQGGDYQGGDYQGGDYQGSDFAGATLGGITLGAGGGLYMDRALSVWRTLRTFPPTHEQRLPDRICTWNSTRTVLQGCTMAGSVSPLAGVAFPATFTRDGTTFPGTVRIVNAAGSVAKDTSMAMHPLEGHLRFKWPGQLKPPQCTLVVAGSDGCENPRGCLKNCDLWTYDLELVNADGTTDRFCPSGTRAYAVPGTYAEDGTFTDSDTTFTFACQNGTIAKCTRWGYRSFDNATLSDGSTLPLVDYHQSCIRAAVADYCANGHSFTRDGTLVDLWDYEHGGEGPGGLVPSLLWKFDGDSHGGLLEESGFDKFGAVGVHYFRYAELESLGSIADPAVGCPARFIYRPGEVGAYDWIRRSEYGSTDTWPRISVATTTTCQHSELLRGKYLSRDCSVCARHVGFDLPHCVDPASPEGWDNACVSRANEICGGVETMAPHHECESGEKLEKYSTGCTFRVCKDNPSCCSTQWTSTCAAQADALCPPWTGTLLLYSFCGGSPLENSP